MPVPGPGLGQRHVRRVGGRGERVDLGHQLGGGRQAGERRGNGTGRRGHRCGGAATGPPGGSGDRRPIPRPAGADGHRPVVQHVLHRTDRFVVVLPADDELPVQRAALLELGVRTAVGDPPGVQYHDPVGQVQRGPAVRDDQRGPAAHDLVQRIVDLGLQARVDGRGRVVEDEQAGVGDQRPGQRHPLPLAAGQGKSLLAHHRVVAQRQPLDELVRLGGPGRRQDLLVGRVRPAVGDVGPHRVGEQEALLHDQPDRGAQGVTGHVGDVVPADPDRAGLRVVEPRQQQGEGGLAGSGRSDHGDRLARFDSQRQAA